MMLAVISGVIGGGWDDQKELGKDVEADAVALSVFWCRLHGCVKLVKIYQAVLLGRVYF